MVTFKLSNEAYDLLLKCLDYCQTAIDIIPILKELGLKSPHVSSGLSHKMNKVYVVFQCDFQIASSSVVFVCGSESTAKEYCDRSPCCCYEVFDYYD